MILIKTTYLQRASSRSRHCQDGSLLTLFLVAIYFKWQYSEKTQREMYSYCNRESFDIMTGVWGALFESITFNVELLPLTPSPLMLVSVNRRKLSFFTAFTVTASQTEWLGI